MKVTTVNNRKEIEKCCKELNIENKKIYFIREKDYHQFHEVIDDSWVIEFEEGAFLCYYFSFNDVKSTLEILKKDIIHIRRGVYLESDVHEFKRYIIKLDKKECPQCNTSKDKFRGKICPQCFKDNKGSLIPRT